jgi:hypothetical protein
MVVIQTEDVLINYVAPEIDCREDETLSETAAQIIGGNYSHPPVPETAPLLETESEVVPILLILGTCGGQKNVLRTLSPIANTVT